MIHLQAFQSTDLPALVQVWNRTFLGGPNFIAVTERELAQRVTDQPSFRETEMFVARREEEVVGFVHFGLRIRPWPARDELARDPAEGHIYALVAPEADGALIETLLTHACERLALAGARRALLYPSWVQGVQPFYNGIAGAYEMPGLARDRQGLREVAAEQGFEVAADYATPELDLSRRDHIRSLLKEGARLGAQAARWELEPHERRLRTPLFPPRRSVELTRDGRVVAMAAYGLWEEYARQYGRGLFGITSVQVESRWQGKGLGKLAMILAIEAAMAEGAEALHLHVYRENRPAWNLYHRALGFRPAFAWITLARPLP